MKYARSNEAIIYGSFENGNELWANHSFSSFFRSFDARTHIIRR